MILAVHDLKKSFGDRVIVKNGSFHIEDREKAAFIGINGAGKSTVLKMIVGEEPSDGGTIVLTRGRTIGYLPQQQSLESQNSIYEEVRSARADLLELEEQIRLVERQLKSLSGEELTSRLNTYHRLMSAFESENGYAYESEVIGVLKGLGFTEEEFSKKTGTLSGGQKTQVALGKLLLTKPDILLLDEPTNHLDLNSVSWLETYLLNYPGAVFIVSHDRFFLDRVVTKVVEIENGEIRMYSGDYKAYAEKKKQLREIRMREYLAQQREIRHQEAVIEKLRSFNREKSIKRAESREKLLKKITVLDRPDDAAAEMHLSLEPSCTSGQDVLSVEGLTKSYGRQVLFSGVSFEIRRGEHVAVIGENGTGKTTLLKIINGLTDADLGSVTLGTKVHIGYYDQEHQVLHEEKSIFDEISDEYPSLTNTEIRNTLAAFQFTGDDVFKQIGDLSGGEKGRVSLAKLMLSEANFLILDEPTNHLDMISREILEQALGRYTGTILYVSHDRYFINQTASRILELTGQTFVDYIGNYDYYLEKRDVLTAVYAGKGTDPSAAGAKAADIPDTKANWQEQKEKRARERKRQNDLQKTEGQISLLEGRNSEIDLLLAREDVFSDPQKCLELSEEKEKNEAELEILYAEWEKLAE